MRGFCPLASAIVVSVVLLESFTRRSFGSSRCPGEPYPCLRGGIGLLLGLIGYFAGDSWDLLFEMFYGPQGKWLDTTGRPFLVFSPGQTLKRHRNQAAQAIPRKPDAEDESTGGGQGREATGRAMGWDRAAADPFAVHARSSLALPVRGHPGPLRRRDLPPLRRRGGGPPLASDGRSCLVLTLACLVPTAAGGSNTWSGSTRTWPGTSRKEGGPPLVQQPAASAAVHRGMVRRYKG